MNENTLKLSPKQAKAWRLLDSPNITEVFAGGGAGGGKSLLGCLRQIYRRTKYAGTRGFIGRENFTGLRDSTMKTYFELLAEMGYRSDEHYRYNAQEHTIYFHNGSEQHFRHMAHQPSDPDYNRFGSTEYTDAFVDEAPEVAERACQVLLSRLRYKHREYGITPEILYTGNPGESWVKYEFVMDSKGELIKLPPHRGCVLFTIMDNPDEELRESYTRTLNMLDDYDRARLLYGDWSARPNVDRPFAFAFDASTQVSDRAIHQSGMLTIVSIDFNVQPFCASLKHIWQDGDGWHNHTWAEISVDNGSIEEMANRIRSMVDVRMIEITGDAMGNNRRVKIKESDNANLFISLRHELKLHTSQIRVKSNPFHKQSRENFNFMLQNVDFCVHPSCTGTIRDLRTVEIDTDGKIIKTNRSKESELADFLDNERYAENVYFEKFRKLHGRK